jgi:hypothetical protein
MAKLKPEKFNANIAWENKEPDIGQPIKVYKGLRGTIGKRARFSTLNIPKKWKAKPSTEHGIVGVFDGNEAKE